MIGSARFGNQEEFEDITSRHSNARYESDRIINEHSKQWDEFEDWKHSGVGQDFDEDSPVRVNKKKRSIEPKADFGHFTSDIVTESGSTPTDVIPQQPGSSYETVELSQKDEELSRLVSLDEEVDGVGTGENFDERDDEIVGLQREKDENISPSATRGKQMTVKEKIEKELDYVTAAMGLDPF